MGSITSYSRKALVIIVSISFIFNTQSSQASTLAGGSGWRVASTLSNGIGVTVNGVKDIIVNGASKTVTGVANVTPTAGQVGKFIGKNVAVAAVVGAVDLLLDGVDWVIDEGGKVTKKPTDTDSCGDSNCQFAPTFYKCNYTNYSSCNKNYSSPSAAVNAFLKEFGSTASVTTCNTSTRDCDLSGSTPFGSQISFNSSSNPNYNPAAPLPANVPINDKEGKPLTLTSLGQMVIDQAETEVKTGNPAVPIATPVTQAAATAVVGEAATDETQARPITAELDKSAAIPTTETAVGEIAPPTTNPDTGQPNPTPLSLDFPVFCSWAPSLCLMADKVQQSISDVAAEYADKPQENNDTKLEIPEPEQIEVDTDISFGGSCPTPLTSQVNFMGINETIEFSFEPVCEIAQFIKPVVISISAFSAALIVAGIRTEDD
jgi:hypothetical protein